MVIIRVPATVPIVKWNRHLTISVFSMVIIRVPATLTFVIVKWNRHFACEANTVILAQDGVVECEWLYNTILRHAKHFFFRIFWLGKEVRERHQPIANPNFKHMVNGSQSHCCRWSRTGCMATILTAAFSVRVSSCSWNRVAEQTFVQRICFEFVKQFCKTDDFAHTREICL